MRLGRTVKRILALGTGAALMGATILGATAASADLSQYPAPFVANGLFNAQLVVGDTAASADVIGAVDIATRLQFQSRTAVTTTGVIGSTTSVADSVKIETSGQKLYYNDAMNAVKQTITATDWPTVLKSGSVTDTDGVAYTYTQQLSTPNLKAKFSKAELDKESPVLFFNTQDNTNGYPQYALQIDFPQPVNLAKLANKVLTIAGRDYTVGSASEQVNTSGAEKLVLYGGGLDKTFEAGETSTVTVGSAEVQVGVTGVNSQANTATISVNGESASVTTGTTQVLGGIRVYVRDIMTYNAPQTSGRVRLFIGTNKMVLEHNTWVTTGDGSRDVDGVKSYFTNNGNSKISRIQINSTPYQFSDPVKGLVVGSEVKDQLFGTFKMMFTGVNPALDATSRDLIRFAPSGSTRMSLQFVNKHGVKYGPIDFLQLGNETDATQSAVTQRNSASRRFIVDPSTVPVKNQDYFTINHNEYSHILELTAVKNSSTSRIVRVKDVGTSESNDWSWTLGTGEGVNGAGTMIYDGYTFNFNVSYSQTDTLSQIMVQAPDASFASTLYTLHGALITIPNLMSGALDAYNQSGSNAITITEMTNYMDSKNPDDYGVIGINISGQQGVTGNKVRLKDNSAFTFAATAGSAASEWIQDGASGYKYVALTAYGTLLKSDVDTSGGYAEVYYPGAQMSYDVFFAGLASTASGAGGSESGTVYQTNKVQVGSAVLASEVAGKELTKNLLVVGGPCANAVAATLLGVTDPATCAAGYTEGKAKLKLIQGLTGQGNNVALLVAGATAWDTRRASRVLAEYEKWSDKLKGTEVEVVGVSQAFTDLQVNALTPQ